ncbi:MAG: hypothetical protein AB8E82_05570 [Aureispira sp.]
MTKKLALRKAPWGVRHDLVSEKQQYVISASTFDAGSWFIIAFTVIWTAAFIIFAYSTIQDILTGNNAFEWFNLIFFFSHGIPAVFLCWFSFAVIFERVTLTIDQQHLYHVQGVFGKGKEDVLNTPTITAIKLQNPYIVIGNTVHHLEIGESLPQKRQEFIIDALQSVLQQMQQYPSFLNHDLSQHLIE